jgi:hypothetical protein
MYKKKPEKEALDLAEAQKLEELKKVLEKQKVIEQHSQSGEDTLFNDLKSFLIFKLIGAVIPTVIGIILLFVLAIFFCCFKTSDNTATFK